MNPLRLHVEKVVRPLAASERRKDRMRQELHAHLNAAYEEEIEKLGDEQLAIQRTLERFGNVIELRRQLQATVPMLEQILFREAPLPAIGRRVGESPLRHGLRISLLVYSCSFGFALIVCGVALTVRYIRGERPNLHEIASFALPIFAMLLVLHVVFPVLSDRMRKSICAGFAPARSLPMAALWGFISSMLTFAAGVTSAGAFNLSARGEFFREFERILIPLIGISAAMQLLLALYAVLSAREIRRFDEDPWRVVEIDE